MLWLRALDNIINKLREKSIKIVLNDYASDFHELLENINDISNQESSNLVNQTFQNKKHELAPSKMKSMLNVRVNTCNLRAFKKPKHCGLETLRFSQLYFLLLETFKETSSLSQFKTNIRQWVYSDCPCSLF